MSAITAPAVPTGAAVLIESGTIMHADPACPLIDGDTVSGTYPERTGWVCPCCDDAFGLDMTGGTYDVRMERPAPERNPGGERTSRDAVTVERTATATAEEVAALVDSLGRKFTVEDMTTGLIEFAQVWLTGYAGNFDFLLDVRSKMNASGRDLSAGQAKGVLNCFRADHLRAAKVDPVESTLNLRTIPSGRYAVPGSDGRLKIQIDNVEKEGRWKGWVFVKDAAEYGAGRKYGAQRPEADVYSGEIVEALTIIAADPVAAMAAYGHLVGRCGRCERHLEDEVSIERGIGPICWAKMNG